MTAASSDTHGPRRRADAPGALRSQATLEIQTRHAQRLVYGRAAAGSQHEIVGLLRFAAMLRPIWSGSATDDPYADWWLVQVERELMKAREQLQAMKAEIDRILAGAPAVNVVVAQSLAPARLELNFSNPYAFHGAYLLADFDVLVRAVLTARHVGLMDLPSAERLLAQGGRVLRSAYETAKGYRFMAVTRADLTQGTAKAAKAREAMGDLPQLVLAGELRAAYAPKARAQPDDPRDDDGEEVRVVSGEPLDGAPSDGDL